METVAPIRCTKNRPDMPQIPIRPERHRKATVILVRNMALRIIKKRGRGMDGIIRFGGTWSRSGVLRPKDLKTMMSKSLRRLNGPPLKLYEIEKTLYIS